MKISGNYRFGQKDVDAATKALAQYFLNVDAPWTKKLDLAELALLADNMQKKTSAWPTVSETEAEFWRREDEYWQRNFGKEAPREKER